MYLFVNGWVWLFVCQLGTGLRSESVDWEIFVFHVLYFNFCCWAYWNVLKWGKTNCQKHMYKQMRQSKAMRKNDPRLQGYEVSTESREGYKIMFTGKLSLILLRKMPCCCSCTMLTAILVNFRRLNEPVLVRTVLISGDALSCLQHLLITSVIALAGMAEDICTCSDPEDHQQVMQLSLLHLLHMAVIYISEWVGCSPLLWRTNSLVW